MPLARQHVSSQPGPKSERFDLKFRTTAEVEQALRRKRSERRGFSVSAYVNDAVIDRLVSEGALEPRAAETQPTG